ncbi:MAG: DUF5103 domain-containing protein [Odoribacter sp.]
MIRFFLYFFFFIFGTCGYLSAQSLIKTVQCFPVGQPFAEPVIELGTAQQLAFSFDDLSTQVNTYTYKIQHCDPDWNSSNLSPFTYLNGFFSNPLENYAYSFNTVVPYTRFSLLIPNDEVSMKLSGNYLLQVFNDANPDSAVISQRFSVFENKVGISATIVNATNPNNLYTSQQLNFTVSYNNLPIYNPIQEVRAYVLQNQDPHSRRNFTPTFIQQNQLVYGDGINNLFNGLSPFRNFQCTSLVYFTQYVKDILKGPDGLYNVILQPGTVPQRYLPLADRDGNYYIQAENVQNPHLEADYVTAHFAILYPQPIPNADIYIYGKFANWQLLPALKMTYDYTHKAYVGTGEVKQGYYDYMYAVVPANTGKPDFVTMQNNFYQTPNEYSIRFYYYDRNLMYFRFVGYQTLTSNL